MPSGIACTCGNKSAPMVVLRMLVGSLAIRFPAMGGLVAAVGCADRRTFVGSLYGVSARVDIDMISRIADVELSGVPAIFSPSLDGRDASCAQSCGLMWPASSWSKGPTAGTQAAMPIFVVSPSWLWHARLCWRRHV